MSRNFSTRQAKVRETTLANWKRNKVEIDHNEYYNGRIYMHNISPATSEKLTQGSWLQFAKALKTQETGKELNVLLELDRSPLTQNGVLKVKWEEHTGEQLNSGDSWFRKALVSDRYAFSILGELPINNRIKVFTFEQQDDTNKDTTINYYVIEEINYTRERDGTIVKTDVKLVNAVELLDQDGITADFKWTTTLNRPMNVKKLKVSFDKGVIFNSLILGASPNGGATATNIDLIAQGRIADVKAPNWSLMPLFPANDIATIWKSEWPFETTYYEEMKTLTSNTVFTGATVSERIASEIETGIQAQTEIQNWFAGTKGNPQTNPNKLYSGKNNNGYSIISFSANAMGNETTKIGRAEVGASGLGAVEAYSNWYSSTINLRGSFKVLDRDAFFVEGFMTQFRNTSFYAKGAEVYRMGTFALIEKRGGVVDGIYCGAGGVIANKYYASQEFQKDFITQQFDYLGTPFQAFPSKLEAIDKPKLADYSLADRKYFCLVQNDRNSNLNQEVDNNTSQGETYVKTNTVIIGDHRDNDLSAKSDGKMASYARVFGFRYFSTPYVDWTIPPSNLQDQTATLQNTYFNVNYDDTYAIEIDLDTDNWAFNTWGVRAWGQNGCKVKFEFINNAGNVVQTWEKELSSNLVSTNSTTSKSYII